MADQEMGDNPRGRGGFRKVELRTIPSNVNVVRATNLTQFKEVKILANYVPIKPLPNSSLHMYRIDYEPQVESLSLMRYLFKTAARKIFQREPMHDGVHECRSGQKLDDKTTIVDVSDTNTSDAKSYKITFTYTGVTAMGEEMVRTYNIHMKEFFRLLSYFQPQPGLHVTPAQSFAVGQDIMVLRGFRTAANALEEGKLMMNFEASHKLMQKDNVCQIMRRIKDNAQGQNPQEVIRSQLVGKLVVTSYNKRAYRVEDVDFGSTPKSTFSKRDGSQTSFVDYFRNSHSYNIRDVDQPMLTVVPSNRRRRGDEDKDKEIKLVPEMCNIAGLTDNQRNDNRLKMDLIRASQIAPQERVQQLRSFLASFHANQEIQAHLTGWGYTYDKDAFRMTGFVIQPTVITSGGDNKKTTDVNTADFQIRSLAATPTIRKMAIIVGRGELPNKQRILGTLKSGFDSINLVVSSVDTIDMQDGDQASHYVRRIKTLDPSVTVAIVVIRTQNKVIYDAIKKTATNECGIITQVVTSRLMTDERKARSAATKIAIQIAAKVGGEPWWVDIPLKGSMVCGYDTYHDTAQRGRSFGAFLASMNEKYSKWFSKADQHDKLDEMSSQVATNMLEALNAYKKLNNRYPERVIIYRDGVGEGQIEHVFKFELLAIKEKIKSVDAGIRLTMILVNKRIGARFYMLVQNNQFVNPPPGTVIDHGVTRQERFDFYLISQSTRQGTISPTYYNIIHDESGLVPAPEIHQKLAYKLCLLYYNWSGSVRVPAPCQYAHKLALLCGEHLHAQPNANLSDRLHFL